MPSDFTRVELKTFQYEIPKDIVNHFSRADGSLAYINYDNNKYELDAKDYRIFEYELDTNSMCNFKYFYPPSSSNSVDLTISWSKYDFMPAFGDGIENEDATRCLPPKHVTNEHGGRPDAVPPYTAYMFCSEKDTKTVIICLSLMQDNPNLAKDIFSSFRWLGAEEETEQLLKEVGL